jgi:hypothetical protein
MNWIILEVTDHFSKHRWRPHCSSWGFWVSQLPTQSKPNHLPCFLRWSKPFSMWLWMRDFKFPALLKLVMKNVINSTQRTSTAILSWWNVVAQEQDSWSYGEQNGAAESQIGTYWGCVPNLHRIVRVSNPSVLSHNIGYGWVSARETHICSVSSFGFATVHSLHHTDLRRSLTWTTRLR